MKKGKIGFAACIMLVIAATNKANAEFIVNGVGQTDTQYFFQSPLHQDFAFEQQEIHINTDEQLQFDMPWSLGSADHGSIDSWVSNYSGEVNYSSNSFSINASSSIQGILNEGVSSSTGFAQTQNNMGYSATIDVTEETLARISFDGFVSAYANSLSHLDVEVTVSTLLGSFSNFSAGFNSDTQITNPFSFDAILLQNEQITLSFVYNNRVLEGVDVQTVFEQSLNGSFSITAVPAPGGAACFGLAGLVLTYRRR